MSASALLLRRVEVDGDVCDVRLGHGRVLEVGGELDPRPGEEELDGAGAALLPGLHDHHAHLFALAASLESISVGPPEVTGPEAFDAVLRAADEVGADGAWIRGTGYHEGIVGLLDRHRLDTLVPRRPVRIQHRSGRLWVMNTAGVRALGAIGDHALPPTGRSDPDWMRTGLLYDADLDLRRGDTPPDFSAVGRLLHSYGVTGVSDMTRTVTARDLEHLAHAAPRALGLRIVVSGDGGFSTVPPPLGLGPVKIVLEEHALPGLEELVDDVARAHRAGRRVAVHTVGRTSLVLAVVAWRTAGGAWGDRIEHGAVIPDELLDDLGDLGLTVVTQPNFLAERGDEYLADVEPDDLPALYRCRSLLDHGVGVALGTDSPFGHPDPWRAIAAAVARRSRSGRVLGEAECISSACALGMFLTEPCAPTTRRAIAPGVSADLCLLDAPLGDVLASPSADHVACTIFDGEVVYARGDPGAHPPRRERPPSSRVAPVSESAGA
jgi:predicted amidohydrolase YtcJ